MCIDMLTFYNISQRVGGISPYVCVCAHARVCVLTFYNISHRVGDLSPYIYGYRMEYTLKIHVVRLMRRYICKHSHIFLYKVNESNNNLKRANQDTS